MYGLPSQQAGLQKSRCELNYDVNDFHTTLIWDYIFQASFAFFPILRISIPEQCLGK